MTSGSRGKLAEGKRKGTGVSPYSLSIWRIGDVRFKLVGHVTHQQANSQITSSLTFSFNRCKELRLVGHKSPYNEYGHSLTLTKSKAPATKKMASLGTEWASLFFAIVTGRVRHG